ncbi:isocitrate lyase/phosphoenolpyruvate mutase family protein [Streptomyces sp. RB6PN25]|uniref:Isocitrate lyase/phosphoenolpyruvate mutase family protein n=1 Tax=Streptomyces humicola TaxID=2953240 RepID=A0ABT1PYX3_9ACTN|nr:isocitrate lyase/phosphoenolpyruvate mutase family protein [Streptomyces humicola]MCQ4082875.1 isocitrate lyase/phosphoenolpyruvate mutase family protein [Streptomyces humicola]
MSDFAPDDGFRRFQEFRELHHREQPLLLPNAWDHASAAALAARGFRAIGTTSLGVAAAAGMVDGAGATRAQTVALALGLARLDALITVDIEGGFGEDPGDVAALAAELADAGIVGVNIEDGRADGSLAPVARQREVIAAVKERVPHLFVNARTDTHWLREAPSLDVTLRRVEAYQQEGADGVFVPGLVDDDSVRSVVEAVGVPLNVLFAPGRVSYDRLAELGVRRISTGSLLFRAALDSAVETAWAVAHPDAPVREVPSYGEVQALAERFRG